jgi:hypothetical protein
MTAEPFRPLLSAVITARKKRMRLHRIALGVVGLAALLGLAALPATAQITGTWSGTMATADGGNGTVSYTFVEEEDGVLTGSSTGPDANVSEISDGMIDGQDVTFNLTVDFGGMPLTMAFTGVMMDDTIDFSVDMFGMPFPITVTREPEGEEEEEN